MIYQVIIHQCYKPTKVIHHLFLDQPLPVNLHNRIFQNRSTYNLKATSKIHNLNRKFNKSTMFMFGMRIYYSKGFLPAPYFLIIKSYIENKYFMIHLKNIN